MDFDCDSAFDDWQRQLDKAGINFDVTNLVGATFEEIDNYVRRLLAARPAAV